MTHVEPNDESRATESTSPEDSRPVREYRGTGIMWSAICLGIILVAFIIVVIQNAQNVQFQFLWLDVETPLSLIVAVTVAASLVLGEAIGFVWRRRRRSRLQEREELKRLRGRTG